MGLTPVLTPDATESSQIMPKLIRKPTPGKPAKPHPDFPLFPHATGRWAKKVRGEFRYFGKVANDPKGEAALLLWLDQKDDLLAGRTPRTKSDGLTVRDLVNRFLTAKRHQIDACEITQRTFDDYYQTCGRLTKAFGIDRLVSDLASDDFELLRAGLTKTWGPVATGNEVTRVRVVFKYGYDAGLFDSPMRFGPTFKRPSKKVLRKARQDKGPRMFEAKELHAILKGAGVQLRAMVLLGINCGFGNSDVGTLPIKALDLKGGWINYPRPKTGVDRRCPLWPETIKALKDAIAARPTPKDDVHAGLVFLTRCGEPWAKQTVDNPVSKETAKLLKALGIQRPGLSFYALRHTFETIAGDSKDQVAVDAIMGHARDDMASRYRERIADDRLRAVSDHVRKWLFPKTKPR